MKIKIQESSEKINYINSLDNGFNYFKFKINQVFKYLTFPVNIMPPVSTNLYWFQPSGITSYVSINNLKNPKSISVSINNFGCFVTGQGKVVCFGNNDAGQCSVPSGLSAAKQVSCGYNHTVALLEDGSIIGWGATASGVGIYGTQTIQQQITAAGLTVSKIDAGAEHALALLSNGDVVAWGKNESAQLSDTDVYWTWPGYPPLSPSWAGGYATQTLDLYKYYTDRSSLYDGNARSYRCSSTANKRGDGCESPNASGLTVHWLWTNAGSTLSPSSLLAAGLTLGWEFKTGAPYDYQFSRATTNDPTSINYGGGGWTAAAGVTSAIGTSSKKYTDISAGRSHNLLLTTDGKVELWGLNFYYNVSGSGNHSADSRQDCPDGNCFKRIGSGSGKYDTILGKTLAYGDNTWETVKSFKTTSNSVSKIATSYYGNIVIKPDGTVFAWDRNDCGECTNLSLPAGVTFAFVNGAYRHNLGIGTDGSLAISGCWYNSTAAGISAPYVPSLCDNTKYTWAGGSDDWSVATLNNGSLIAWGRSISKITGLTIYQ